MKKLYLILLMLLILFIPMKVNAVAIYQLNQPISGLNGHTLREVFEEEQKLVNNTFDNYLASWFSGGVGVFIWDYSRAVFYDITSDYGFIAQNNVQIINNIYYARTQINVYQGLSEYLDFGISSNGPVILNPITSNQYDMSQKYVALETLFLVRSIQYTPVSLYIDNVYLIDLTALGIDNLTTEQMDMYFNLYLEAVRFEQENIEASQDIGGYQNIFRSVINGVKNLMTEMGNVWQFLNAPIMTSDIRDFKFEIDWSWDLIGMLGQVLSSVQVLTLQVVLLVPSLVFQLFGIPIQVSILSLLFSNFIFLVLGWIIVKSFLI